MLDAIRSARSTINFAAYIFESDEVGHQFRDAFCERARAGIEVRILLDGIGSSWGLDNSDVRMMRNAGCKFAYYHPTASWRVDRTNRRLHRRLLVVDGRIAFIGSAGFGVRWSGHAQDKDHWRDTQARIEGPIVAKLQSSFNEHWVKTFGETLSGDGQFPVLSATGSLKAQVIASHSFSMAPVPIGPGNRIRCSGKTDLDNESLLHADRRSGGSANQGRAKESRCQIDFARPKQ